MISERDIEEAIAECNGIRNPDASTCIKLAAFYTIREHLFPKDTDSVPQASFSYAPPQESGVIDFPGESEFAQAVDGRKQSEIWPVLDEMMMTVEAINPRLYNAVMRKLH
jgi:hypothetical protein